MNSRPIYLFVVLTFIVFSTVMISCSVVEKEGSFSELVKVSLRDVGHQLLLTNQDSTSIILPIISIDNSKYKLSFQNKLSFEPGNLVDIVKSSFNKASLPANYLVEVINCTDKEVAYSYEMQLNKEKSIIPCSGRFLPINCYIIEVKFTDKTASAFSKQTLLYVLIFGGFTLLLLFFFNKRKRTNPIENNNSTFSSIGSFRFYPKQNKLVKAAVEISLSKKECELLEIFVANPNQVIKREDLMKKVWEDNGVFVGRSLDTYISKLRKKFKDDDAIKLTNIHGIGYKLEINC